LPFRRRKKSPRTCPQGHPQEPTWDKCPFCTAKGIPKESRTEDTPAPPAAPQIPETGRGAVVVSKKKRAPAARRALAGWLVAISGEHEGEDFRLHVGRNVLGKGTQADIVIKDAYISERHASFESKNGTCTVTDLDTRHGTLVNGRKISGPENVADGDRISIGHTELKFRSFE
jgi:hypothetical protein